VAGIVDVDQGEQILFSERWDRPDAGGLKFIVLSAVLYAPGTLLYSWSRSEQNQTVFKTSACVIFILVGTGAMAGLYGLATGSITI
jgi:arginine:ornithine antiporter/lysine permease